VGAGCDGGGRGTEPIYGELRFFAAVAGTSEDGVNEVGVVDVDFVWADSNYRT
jgi:hypothetical protein